MYNMSSSGTSNPKTITSIIRQRASNTWKINLNPSEIALFQKFAKVYTPKVSTFTVCTIFPD